MTIYAIVNDLIEAHDIQERPAIWSIVSQAGILQGGNPYFVPDFSERFEIRCALAIRIGRLGKGIAPRFAHRYVGAVAPATLFVASELLERLRSQGLPWTQAISYDRCLAIGQFEPLPYDSLKECSIDLRIENQADGEHTDFTHMLQNMDAGAIIEQLSRDNTLKTGDIILAGIAGKGPETIPDHSVRLSLNGKESLRFNIR